MRHVDHAVAPDGRHFAMVATRAAASGAAPAGPETVVVLNWVSGRWLAAAVR